MPMSTLEELARKAGQQQRELEQTLSGIKNLLGSKSTHSYADLKRAADINTNLMKAWVQLDKALLEAWNKRYHRK